MPAVGYFFIGFVLGAVFTIMLISAVAAAKK